MSVYIEVRVVGQCFGCCAVLCRVGTGRKVAETSTVRPYGFDDAAYVDGKALAAKRGYAVVEVA